MTQIEPVASHVPWMTTDGNHERNCPCFIPPATAVSAGINWLNGSDSGGECGVPYGARFTMPQAAPDSPWYSFQVGPVAVVLMSTEHDFSNASTQLADLVQLLDAVDRNATPWLLFGGHRPMFVDSPYPAPSCAPLQSFVEPLLVEYGVDVALWGHHHSYQRSCPMIGGICMATREGGSGGCSGGGEASDGAHLEGRASQARPHCSNGIVHAVIGAAGYEFSPVATGDDVPVWVAYANDTKYGYAAIDATPTSFHFAFVRADGEGILDEFTLHK